MKVPMKSMTIYGMKNDRKKVMEFLQKKGAVEFRKVEGEGLDRIDVSDSIVNFERYISTSKRSLEILDKYAPEKTPMFFVRETLGLEMFSMNPGEGQRIGNITFDIVTSSKKIEELKLKSSRIAAKIDAMQPWLPLNVPLSYSGTGNTKALLSVLPYSADEEKIYELLGEANTVAYIEIVSSSKDMTCIFMTYLKEHDAIVQKALRENGFGQPPFTLSHLTAEDKIKELETEITDIETKIEDYRQKLTEYAKNRNDIKLFLDHLQLRRDKYSALTDIGQTEKTFIIEGYVPEPESGKIKAALEASALCIVEISDIPDDEDAPVLLKNNGFAEPVEGITSTYSMPSRFDIDPNFIMAIFYYIFFGMMFSDAGYGILVMLVTGYIAFFAKAEHSTKNTMKMFFFCGVSTTFWGFMYGSFFGDAVTQIGRAFFGHPEWKFPALWLDPVSEPLTLLIVSVAIGAVQIITGLMIAFHTNWRKGDRMTALFDIGSWILIIIGIAMFACGMGFNEKLLPFAYQLLYYGGIGIVIVGFAMIVLMKGRANKNPILRLGSGILGLYDITSYVSDALSYSRLMALGLSTGVIAQVVNTMGTLGGNSFVGWIMFILISLVGHAINFSINMLGAYVHTNRLQYVEFFGKFYEGGGREFTPLKMNTKYYKFTEED